MFWKFDLHMSSQLEALLEKDDVTLTELMEEEDVLQECKAQNHRLLVFLSQDTCMQELLHLITTEPPAGLEETRRFKHPNIACELLTSDVGVINDKLGGEKLLLDTLYSFLEQPPPLNPLLASFFSKTIGNLITRKTEQVISFLRGKEGFLGLVLNHINTSAMMDLLLRLISCVEPAPLRQDTLNWLNEEQLAQRLIELIHPGKDEEKQSNASQTVCDIIRLSRDQANQLQENSEADPLLAVLESQECVGQLLDNMFVGERTESCIICGTQILLTLLEIRRPGVEGMLDVCVQGHERCVNSSILQAIQPHLTHYHQLLLDPPRVNFFRVVTPMLTSLGVLEVPLGNCRLHVARLMASLLQTTNTSYYICCNNTIYNNTVTLELCRLNTINILLDLFFKYTWNNFLHFQVELCVAAILSHSAQEQRPLLFQDCRLVLRILEAWEENDKMQAEGGMRRGYMGHLTRIANTVVCSMEKGPVHSQISSLITELLVDCKGRWETFVDQALTEINRKNTVDLTFSDYQIQQITANFVDQFGFNDDEFSEHGDNINATFDRIAEINFNVDTEDTAKTAAFEACTKEKIQSFDDNEEEDIWEEREINYTTHTKSRTRFGGSRTSVGAAQSDGVNPWGSPASKSGVGVDPWGSPTPKSEVGVDSWDSPAPKSEVGVDAWGSPAPQPITAEKGWAKFTDFQPFCCSETGPRCTSPVDSEICGSDKTKPTCVWSVCVARKAPLVASDSSSSGGSESDEEDKTESVTMETVSKEMYIATEKHQPKRGVTKSINRDKINH
uniref:Protein phosphatase 6, regulatory subunit 2b n=1 Tax=Oncorhynchus kisutch TaxID=8019 RepID=A0A8C7J2F6_ONCKI